MDYSCAGSLDLFFIFSCRPCAPLVRRSVAWRRRLSPCSLSAFFLRHWSQLDSIYGISLREVWTFWITAYRKFRGQKSCTQNKSFKPTCPETPQASQADVTGVLCKLTFSRESRCRVTSNRWDFVWEMKYWGPRTPNIIIAFIVRRTQHIILGFPWYSVEIPVVLISSYVCIFCAILNNLSRGCKNVNYCTNVLSNGCLAQWIMRCSPSSKVLGFDSCRARIFTFFRNRFVLFPFLKEHIGSVLQHQFNRK